MSYNPNPEWAPMDDSVLNKVKCPSCGDTRNTLEYSMHGKSSVVTTISTVSSGPRLDRSFIRTSRAYSRVSCTYMRPSA